MGLSVAGHRLHCAVIAALYCTQGLAQGILSAILLILIQRYPEISIADQATLDLPMYFFSLKFLWAPLVDRFYFGRKVADFFVSTSPRACTEPLLQYQQQNHVEQREDNERRDGDESQRVFIMRGEASVLAEPSDSAACPSCKRSYGATDLQVSGLEEEEADAEAAKGPRMHRRIQWVLALQLAMAVCFIVLAAAGGDSFLDVAMRDRREFFHLWVLLMVLALANSTQDVAVDAWAVEGLPKTRAATAGSLQLAGVAIGVSFANVFVQLNSSFPDTCTMVVFCVACATACVTTAIAGVVLACMRPLPNAARVAESEASARTALKTASSLFKTRGMGDYIAILLTRGWPVGVWPLVTLRLISMRTVSAAAVARYRIYSTVLQVFLAASAATRLLKFIHGARVLRYVSGIDFLLCVVAAVAFLVFALPSAAGWFGTAVLLPLTLAMYGLGTFAFVGNVAVQCVFAHRLPHDTGGVLSLLNAIANIGRGVPVTVCLYAASLIVRAASAWVDRDTSYAHVFLTSSSESAVEATSSAMEHYGGGKRKKELAWYWVKMDVLVLSAVMFSLGAYLRYRFLVPAAERLDAMAGEEEEAAALQAREREYGEEGCDVICNDRKDLADL